MFYENYWKLKRSADHKICFFEAGDDVKLTPEQIGRAGELKLDCICNEIALTCVSLIPDLLGVDRHIEFAAPEISPFGSLDTRPAPISCYVQVKAKGPGQRYWQLSLSVAERLAKTGKPAFIALFEVSDRAQVIAGYLAHFRGDLLARVLERLRDAQKRGITDLNRRTINLSRNDGTSFALDGESFATALKTGIGESMVTYATEKNEEVKTLGFGDDRVTASIRFGEVDIEAMVEAHLGERSLPVERMEFTERRFDIPLPFPPGVLTEGTLTIEARPVDGFELCLEAVETGQAVRLPCSFIYPHLPELPPEALKYRILSDLITIKTSRETFTYTAHLNDEKLRSLDSWNRQLSATLMLGSGKCKLSVKRLSDNMEVVLGVSNGPVDADMHEFREVLRLVNAAQFLLAAAKHPEQAIPLEALLANPRELKRAHAIMSEAEGLGHLRFTVTEPFPDANENFGVLFISAYAIGAEWFAYCARATVERGEKPNSWVSGKLTPVITEKLQEPVVEKYKDFRDRMIKITGLSIAFIYSLEDTSDGDVGDDSRHPDVEGALLEN